MMCTNCQTSIPSSDSSPSVISRVTELIACNDRPSDSEMDSIKAHLTGAEQRLQYVEDSITRLRDTLVALECERDTLKLHIAKGKNVLHPVRRMPTKLLAHLFEDCINGENNRNSLDTRGMHWALGRVSRRWQSVMHCTPRLWTDIQVELGTAGTRVVEVQSYPGMKSRFKKCRSTHLSSLSFLLGLYIIRSQSLPLSVSLSLSFDYSVNPSDWDEIHPFLIVLFPTAPRWSSLFLSMEPYQIQKCFGSMKFMFFSLRYLFIQTPSFMDTSLACDVFKFAPVLRKINFDGIPAAHILDVSVPLQQLTSVTIRDSSRQPIDALLLHNCLGQMRQLEELGLDLDGEISSEVPFDDLTSLPHLQALDIRGLVADRLLNLFLLPNLKMLGVHTLIPPSFALIQSLISRSSCALTTLSTNTLVSEDDFIHIVTHNPSLVNLDLAKVQIEQLTDKAITSLVYEKSGQGQLYLPNLATLRLHGNLAFDSNLFVDMVESRWRGCDEGHDIARPQMIDLSWDSESLSQPKNQDAFTRLDLLRGLTWKAVGFSGPGGGMGPSS